MNMATTTTTTTRTNRACSLLCFFFFLAFFALISARAVSATEFRVGGRRGWAKPTGNETETYNQWARRNRFHIGDYAYFKYENDSVLVVDYDDYSNCNVTNPIQEFEDGNTTIKFDRYGFFHFISGKPGHCKSGQKLVIRVMVHPEFVSPQPSPVVRPPGGSPESGWGSGPSASSPTPNSTVKLSTSLFVVVAAALGCVLVTLFLV